MMRRIIILIVILFTAGMGTRTRDFWEPEHPVAAELGMSVLGSSIAGATSWGGYLLWNWGSKAITPESWHQALGTTGLIGLYGLGYGILIPAGAYSGIYSTALSAGDYRPLWGAVLGAYAGTAASIPFAVMALDEASLLNVALAAGSVIVMPSLCSWIGFRLTPPVPPATPTTPAENQKPTSFLHKPRLLVTCNSDRIAASLSVSF